MGKKLRSKRTGRGRTDRGVFILIILPPAGERPAWPSFPEGVGLVPYRNGGMREFPRCASGGYRVDMLRTVFVGYENRLNRLVAHWLAQRTDLQGCVWIPTTTQWKGSKRGRRDFFAKRVRRRGLLRAVDEAAFHLLYHATAGRSHNSRDANALIDEYWRQVGFHSWGPFLSTASVNDPRVLHYLDLLKPDVIFSHCIHEYFGKSLREKASQGVFLWHVGVMPEYKGLYPPFWTLYNGDYGNFGYTLFRLNDRIDEGEIFAQGRIANVDVRRDNHHLIEHKAILASLPDVQRLIKELEAGTARPIDRQGAKTGYYSYPGLTDYVKQRLTVRRNGASPPPQLASERS